MAVARNMTRKKIHMYNYRAKVIKPIKIRRTIWFDVGAEVDLVAEFEGANEVTIVLSPYAKIVASAADFQPIEGTAFVTEE